MKGRVPGVAAAVAGVVVMVLAWEIVGRTQALGPSFPPASRVIAYLVASQDRSVLFDATTRTAREAALGFVAGSAAGCGFAIIAAFIPILAPGIERLAVIVNGIPVIAVGAVCAVTAPPALNPVIVAVLGSFFIVFVAAVNGLQSAPAVQRDVFDALGASRRSALWLLKVPAAVPGVIDGLRASAPIAVVGAIIGEWFASQLGLGQLLVNAMQNYQISLLWSAALLGTLLAGCAYAVLSIAARVAAERFRE